MNTPNINLVAYHEALAALINKATCNFFDLEADPPKPSDDKLIASVAAKFNVATSKVINDAEDKAKAGATEDDEKNETSDENNRREELGSE